MTRYSVPDGLAESPTRIRVANLFEKEVSLAQELGRVTAPGQAKNYFEFLELVNTALVDYQQREGKTESNRIHLTWDKVDDSTQTEVITISLVKREPGRFAQGAPFEGSTKNLRPILRENKKDPENPGYRIAIMGKWYDNLIKFTCWAQTNKEAIERAFWFEEFMEKYTWFFVASGVPRVLFWEQKEETIDNNGNKLYGRSLTYYVKTEDISTISEKELEEIAISLNVVKS